MPLIALAIPSVVIGWLTIGPVLFGDYFEHSIFTLAAQNPLHEMEEEFHGPLEFVIHGFSGVAVYLAAAGALVAWYLYLKRTDIPARLLHAVRRPESRARRTSTTSTGSTRTCSHAASRGLGGLLWKVGDETVIDGGMVNGSARLVGIVSVVARGLQSGYLYHYAFAMIVGLAAFVGWLVLREQERDDVASAELGCLAADRRRHRRHADRLRPRGSSAKQVALGVSILTFVVSIPLFTRLRGESAAMQFVESVPWITRFRRELRARRGRHLDAARAADDVPDADRRDRGLGSHRDCAPRSTSRRS